MDKQEITQLIQQEMQASKKDAQYGPSRVPTHIHNGLDSPKLSQKNLLERQFTVSSHLPATQPATAGNYGHFYIHAPYLPPAAVITLTEVHGVKGTDAGTVSLFVTRVHQGSSSLSTGDVIVTFDLKANPSNVVRYSTLILGRQPVFIYPNQRLALSTSGTLTDVGNVLVTVVLQY